MDQLETILGDLATHFKRPARLARGCRFNVEFFFSPPGGCNKRASKIMVCLDDPPRQSVYFTI